MKVLLLDQRKEEQYERFILSHKYTFFYYSLKFKNFLKDLLECDENYLLAIKNGEIEGVLPLMRKKGKFGYVYNSLPFFGSHGGIISSDREAFEYLLNEYNSLVESKEIMSSTLISNPLISSDYGKLKYNFTDERIGMFTQISFKNSEDLLKKIAPSARRNIKKAKRSGIKVEIDNDKIDFLYQVHVKNMKEINGRSKPAKFFELFKKYFEENKDYNLYIGLMNGIPIAGLLLFYYNQVVEYFIPAIVNEFRTYQPLSLIIFHAMLNSKRMGYKLWNWGGTWIDQEGVYRFKKKWSSFEKRYFYYTYLRDLKILNMKQEDLLKEYEYFYIVPFKYLNANQ